VPTQRVIVYRFIGGKQLPWSPDLSMTKDVIVLNVRRVTATVHDGSPIRRAAGTQQIRNAMFNAALQIRRLMGRKSRRFCGAA
jgi:hypothetical protein